MDSLSIVGRCEKCGREFVYVNPNSDLRDTYLDQIEYGQSTKEKRLTLAPCGGKIKILTPETQT